MWAVTREFLWNSNAFLGVTIQLSVAQLKLDVASPKLTNRSVKQLIPLKDPNNNLIKKHTGRVVIAKN